MTFDPTKPVRTRDGRAARIVATDLKTTRPIVAIVTLDSGELLVTRRADGRFNPNRETHGDLVNIPEQITEFVNLGDAYGRLEFAAKQYPGFPVVKIVREGDRIVSSELFPALDPNA